MIESGGPPSPVSTLVALGILMFIVYRILYALSKQQGSSNNGGAVGGKVFRFPDRARSEPPPTAKLVPYTGERDSFSDSPDGLESHKILVEKAGLVSIGDFTIKEMKDFVIRAFLNPDQFLLGMLYKDPGGRVWVNLVT